MDKNILCSRLLKSIVTKGGALPNAPKYARLYAPSVVAILHSCYIYIEY